MMLVIRYYLCQQVGHHFVRCQYTLDTGCLEQTPPLASHEDALAFACTHELSNRSTDIVVVSKIVDIDTLTDNTWEAE